jgi:hypothetical protein
VLDSICCTVVSHAVSYVPHDTDVSMQLLSTGHKQNDSVFTLSLAQPLTLHGHVWCPVSDGRAWCPVPGGGADALLFGALAVFIGCALYSRLSAVWALIAGQGVKPLLHTSTRIQPSSRSRGPAPGRVASVPADTDSGKLIQASTMRVLASGQQQRHDNSSGCNTLTRTLHQPHLLC